MSIHRTALSSVLLLAALAGCGPDEALANSNRAIETSAPAITTEAAHAERLKPAFPALAAPPAATAGRAERENRTPVITGILIEPFGEITVRHDIIAKPQAKDIDGDEITFHYTWHVNGARSAVDENVLPKSEFRRGDWIDLSIVASDGSTSSEPLESRPFEVANAAPTITSTPGKFDAQGALRYQLTIDDPDDEIGFEYRLLAGPEGMQIDAASGLVSWQPHGQQTGTHSARIEVIDEKGSKAWQSFELVFAPASSAVPAAPSPN
jgi:hypothetical protein